jgi:hypothetical protein
MPRTALISIGSSVILYVLYVALVRFGIGA